jgi:hypothetical protein
MASCYSYVREDNSFPLEDGGMTCVALLSNRPLTETTAVWEGRTAQNLRYKENEMWGERGGGKWMAEAAKRILVRTTTAHKLTTQMHSLGLLQWYRNLLNKSKLSTSFKHDIVVSCYLLSVVCFFVCINTLSHISSSSSSSARQPCVGPGLPQKPLPAKDPAIASSDFMTRVFSRVGLSALCPTPSYPGGPMFSVRVVSLSWLVLILKRQDLAFCPCMT